jgi:hypothetical protein
MGERVELAPFLKKASENSFVCHSYFDSKRLSAWKVCLLTLLFLVGGGSSFFQQAIQEAFPLLKSGNALKNPVLSNARGFLAARWCFCMSGKKPEKFVVEINEAIPAFCIVHLREFRLMLDQNGFGLWQ